MKYSESDLERYASPIGKTEEEKCKNAIRMVRDTVYIVGDICYHTQKGPEWYLRQLKGHKILILSNHDTPILTNKVALHYLERIERMMYVKDGDKDICLCHFPIAECLW